MYVGPSRGPRSTTSRSVTTPNSIVSVIGRFHYVPTAAAAAVHPPPAASRHVGLPRGFQQCGRADEQLGDPVKDRGDHG